MAALGAQSPKPPNPTSTTSQPATAQVAASSTSASEVKATGCLAKDASGKVVNWEVELGPPAMLMRQGWTRNSLNVGDTVTVNGFLAKDGSNLTNAQTVTLSDGKKVFAGSSINDQTTPKDGAQP